MLNFSPASVNERCAAAICKLSGNYALSKLHKWTRLCSRMRPPTTFSNIIPLHRPACWLAPSPPTRVCGKEGKKGESTWALFFPHPIGLRPRRDAQSGWLGLLAAIDIAFLASSYSWLLTTSHNQSCSRPLQLDRPTDRSIGGRRSVRRAAHTHSFSLDWQASWLHGWRCTWDKQVSDTGNLNWTLLGVPDAVAVVGKIYV